MYDIYDLGIGKTRFGQIGFGYEGNKKINGCGYCWE
jgi:hypothetical protein